MKLVSSLFFVLAVPSAAFVSPTQNAGKIRTTSIDKNSESPSSLSASIDVAYVNDAVDVTASIMNNKDILLGAAVAAIGAAAGLSNGNLGGGKKATSSNAEEEELPKIDVSIEYDAPAKLAFSQMGKAKKNDFAKFKELHERKAVLEVKKKVYEQKVAREMEQMAMEIADLQKEIDSMF